MLTTAEITAMRAIVTTSLAGTAIIQSRSFTDDGGGGGTAAWTAGGTVACRLASINGSEREIANRISSDAEFILTLPATTSIGVSSRCVVTGTGNDGTYEVKAIRAWTPSVSKRVEVTQVV